MEAEVHILRVNRSEGHTHLRADQEAPPPPPKPAKWMKLVELVQLIWERGTIPVELVWKILIITPKGDTYTRGMGILDVLW